MRVIAVEEHFQMPGLAALLGDSSSSRPDDAHMLDLSEARIAGMDAAGIQMQILSSGGNLFQNLESSIVVDGSRRSNDYLAEMIAVHPDRFAGFAALPTPDPVAAAKELERSVNELGFKGAMIMGLTNGRFLDDQDFWPIFEAAESLEVPIYLHPAVPPAVVREAYYSDMDEKVAGMLSMAAWGWHADTGLHAIRLMLSGVFDRFPKLQIVLGHLGENIPYMIDRTTQKFANFSTRAERPVSEYFRENFYLSTSGMRAHAPLVCALMVVGADRIMFAVDYPHDDNMACMSSLNTAPVSSRDREKIAHGNAERLFGL
jgi:predicted TIM-barrel fold metal-dependent hydrolase